MSEPSNQENEKYYFEQFAKDFSLPNGEIQYGDKPDVIISGKEQIIGIEIANLYLVDGSDKASEQVQRKRREKVIKLAEVDYKSKSNLNYEFNISFNPITPITNAEDVANKLVKFIISIENLHGDFFTNSAFNISAEIHSVHRSHKEYPDAQWKISKVYDVRGLQVTRVRETLRKKNQLISSYKHCDTYWLLLIVDFMDLAQDQEIDWPVGEQPVESSYEKVIIYKPQFKKYSEIPISNSPFRRMQLFK
jgi:hypothetical protein